MKSVIRKLTVLSLFLAVSVLSGLVTAQEAPLQDDASRTATVKEMQIAGSYVYILVDEQGEDVWLATAPKFINNISYGDVIEFYSEVEMQDFHSKALDRTFDSIWFISRIRVKPDDATAEGAE